MTTTELVVSSPEFRAWFDEQMATGNPLLVDVEEEVPSMVGTLLTAALLAAALLYLARRK